jgi:hypothetical protein
MAGLDPAIHVDVAGRALPAAIRAARPAFAGDGGFVIATWMAGSSPGHDAMERNR